MIQAKGYQPVKLVLYITASPLIKLNTVVNSWLPKATSVIYASWFNCFYEWYLTFYHKNLLAPESELRSQFHLRKRSNSKVKIYQWKHSSKCSICACWQTVCDYIQLIYHGMNTYKSTATGYVKCCFMKSQWHRRDLCAPDNTIHATDIKPTKRAELWKVQQNCVSAEFVQWHRNASTNLYLWHLEELNCELSFSTGNISCASCTFKLSVGLDSAWWFNISHWEASSTCTHFIEDSVHEMLDKPWKHKINQCSVSP